MRNWLSALALARQLVGVVAFVGDGLDVRILGTRKLSALTARSWDSDIKAFVEVIKKLDDATLQADERVDLLHSVEGIFELSQPGWFEAANAEEFEAAMRDIGNPYAAAEMSDAQVQYYEDMARREYGDIYN